MQAQIFEEFFPKAKMTQIKDALKVAIVSQTLPLRRRVSPILWGAPGIGKTSIIEDVAAELGMECVTVIASVYEAVDFGGFPSPKGEFVEYIPTKQLYQLINSDRPAIVFLDEIDKAATSVQNAILRLVLNRELNGLSLPSHVVFALAANPPRQGGEWTLSAPLSNRLVHLYFGCDPNAVADWFESADEIEEKSKSENVSVNDMVDMDVFRKRFHFYRRVIAAFLRKSPQYTLQVPDNAILQSLPFPSPRSWEFTSILLAAADALGIKDGAVRRLLVWGCVGNIGDSFVTFMEENDIPAPQEIVENPSILKCLSTDKLCHAVSALSEYASHDKNNFKAVVSILPFVDMEVGSDVALQVARGLKRVVEKSKDDELRDMLIEVIGRTRLVEIWSASR